MPPLEADVIAEATLDADSIFAGVSRFAQDHASHYQNYPCVLVRLSRVKRDVLEDLLRMSQRYVSSKAGKRRPASRKSKRSRSHTQ